MTFNAEAPDQTVRASIIVAVVDDDDLVRLPVVTLLQDAGMGVVEFTSPRTALPAIAARPDIGLVLTDVNMPGMDGTELAARLHALRPDLPVILMSGQARPPGVVHFIAKPFGQAALLRAIGNASGLAVPWRPCVKAVGAFVRGDLTPCMPCPSPPSPPPFSA